MKGFSWTNPEYEEFLNQLNILLLKLEINGKEFGTRQS